MSSVVKASAPRVAAVVLLPVVGFAGGWFGRQETQRHCYVLPAYTEPRSSSSLLRPSPTVNPPELVCR